VNNTDSKRVTFGPPSAFLPWRRKWQSTPVLLPGKSHGQRSLVGCSLWGRKLFLASSSQYIQPPLLHVLNLNEYTNGVLWSRVPFSLPLCLHIHLSRLSSTILSPRMLSPTLQMPLNVPGRVCLRRISVQLTSLAQSHLTLCNLMDCSTPGLLVHHQLPESTQTHVH